MKHNKKIVFKIGEQWGKKSVETDEQNPQLQ